MTTTDGPAQAETGSKTNARPPAAFYALLIMAVPSLLGAVLGIAGGLSKLASSSRQVEKGYQLITAADEILSVARDAEMGQRAFILTGADSALELYFGAMRRAPAAWADLESRAIGARRAAVVDMRRTFFMEAKHHARSIEIARRDGLPAARRFDRMRVDEDKMEQLRREVGQFVTQERLRLYALREEANLAYRDAIMLAGIGSLALIFAGALLYAAFRQAVRTAGRNAVLAREANQRFQATFEQAEIGMMHLSRMGDAIMVNDALCDLTGYSREEIMAAAPFAPAHPISLIMDPDARRAFYAGTPPQIYSEHWAVAKNGQKRRLYIYISTVRSADGSVAFYSVIVRDVTELRAAEQSLRDSTDRLQRLQDEMAHIGRVNDLGEMAAAIAHEVNQPLTAIANYMSAGQRLAKSLPDEARDIERLMKQVADQALRAGQVIKRMRSFIERREEQRAPEPLTPLVDAAIELALMGADRQRIEIRRVDTASGFVVDVDAIKIQQVLVILIRNAIEAFGTPRGTAPLRLTIRKALHPQNNMVSIFVEDNGPGLDPSLADRIFQPFITSKPGNLGMGLPIAKRIAEEHGGALSLVDATKGAAFRLDLPLSRIALPPVANPA